MKVALLSPPGTSLFVDPPFSWLLRGIADQGHSVVVDPAAAVRNIDAVVALGHQPKRLQDLNLDRLPADTKALVILEPRVTSPEMYLPSTLRKYAYVYAGSPIWARAVGGSSFMWPQALTPEPVSSTSRFRASMIYSNKRSAVHGSLYGLRRKVLRSADSRNVPICVAGEGWQPGARRPAGAAARAVMRALRGWTLPNVIEASSDLLWSPNHALGFKSEKRSALEAARISIVIENSPDYVSEKLFDVIRHGIAAVYVGPELQRFGVPDDVCIQVPASVDAVLNVVEHASESELSQRIEAGLDWLQSSAAKHHGGEGIMFELGGRIGQELDGRESG